MSEIDSGGYIYPDIETAVLRELKSKDGSEWAQILERAGEPGITRRDWLAGLAMQGIVSDGETWDKEDRHLAGLATPHDKRKPIILKAIANRCYELADAMIKEGKE